MTDPEGNASQRRTGGVMRPCRNGEGKPITRTASGAVIPYDGDPRFVLTPEAWDKLDAAVREGAELWWPVTSWLLSQVPYRLDGVPRTTLEMEPMADPGASFEPPNFSIKGLPLPFTHCDFSLDSEMLGARAAGVRVAQRVEQDVLKALFNAEGAARIHSQYPLLDCLELKDELWKRHFYGPFLALVPGQWDTDTLADALVRLEQVEGVCHVMSYDTADTESCVSPLLLMQVTPDVIRIVEGMPLQAMTNGKALKACCIVVPQQRRDFQGNCGIGIAL